jgi:hypothetical protein
MNKGMYVFSQIMGLISHKKFQSIVNQHFGDYKVKDFTCWKQYLCMAFGQLTHRESLSDTMLCLKANSGKLYHLGIGSVVAVSTISRANETRSHKIYETLACQLIQEAKDLYIDKPENDIGIQGSVFAIDATTIDLSLTAFWWATFRSTKGGIKLHTQLDLSTSIPGFILVTPSSVHDVKILDIIKIVANNFYIMDRGYIDYKRLFKIHEHGAYFVTRSKDNMNYRRIYSNNKEPDSGVIYDQAVKLNNHYASLDYPLKIRRIKFKDPDTGKILVFLTNNFDLKAADIAQLYKNRWKIELFFKWIKQHLKIKSFWGQSENAVKSQIWIAISVYVLVAIAKKRFMIKQTLYEILQVLSISIFEKVPVNQLFAEYQLQYFKEQSDNQLKMFDL